MNKMKYAQINRVYPPAEYPSRVPLAASVYLNPLSGRFLTVDVSGNYALSAAADTQIAGWTEDAAGGYSSTEAADNVALIDDPNAVFEIPVYGVTLTASTLKTYIGKTCDLYVAGSTTSIVQSANLTASSTDVIKIVGGDVAKNTVYVRINPTKLFTAGVA